MTHRAALAKGVGVDYSGIKYINIEVPDNKSSIPLIASTDFKGCVINVKNKVGIVVLFSYSEPLTDIRVSKRLVDPENYSSIPTWREGLYLLVLNDNTPWVENRIGHDYPAFRKDVVVVKDGKALNSAIMPYNRHQTNLSCSYVAIRDTAVVMSNVIINRTKESTGKTFCLNFRGA